jgi:Ca2+-transporting ATPase
VINGFYTSGIEVKMITGDFPETAKSIATAINLKNSLTFISGKEVTGMSDEQLRRVMQSVTVFARVLPEVKLRIINTLKAMGEVVAMTGDGVNDGPALKAAHIGIAMGKRGSEVARSASSLVLLNDDLGNMIKAIAFGRNIYSNLKKAIQYIISIHIPLISIVTIPLILGWKFPNLFSPVHVIFLELIMGPTCSIVYENEPMDEKLMRQKPRKISDSLFTWRELSRSVIQGAVITVGLLGLMYFLIENGASEIHTRTIVFSSLVLSNILLTLTGRSVHEGIFKTIRYRNRMVPVIIALTLILLTFSISLPPVLHIFEFETINLTDMAICFSVAAGSVLWIEVYKITGSRKVIPN